MANGNNTTHPVGQKKPNAFGLYDMHGDVWEWCQDRFGPYAGSSGTDPLGPASDDDPVFRVYRGGGWGSYTWYCRSANRYWSRPDSPDLNVGFCLVKTTPSCP